MKAIVQDEYGSADVLELQDIDKPAVKDDDVLLRVHAASAHIGDWHVMRGLPYMIRIMGYGLRGPKARVRGIDVAGRVEAVGKDVSQFQPGDEVFGTCDGCFAEYATARTDSLRPSPRTSPSSRRRPFPPPASPRSRVFATWEGFSPGRRC